jgi:hypothetical protein
MRVVVLGFAAASLFCTAARSQSVVRSEESLECSKQADALGLSGAERKEFRMKCKASAGPSPQQTVQQVEISTVFISTQECSAKYQAAKAAGTLAGRQWIEFRSAECRLANQVKPSTPLPSAPAKVSVSYVANTEPPDAYLALRTDPASSRGQRVMAMPNGTLLEVIERQPDGWWYVRVIPTGQMGWALSSDRGKQWIVCCTIASIGNTSKPNDPASDARSAVEKQSLSQAEIDAFRKFMGSWSPAPGMPPIDVHFRLKRDGMIDGVPEIVSTGSGPLFEAAKNDALRMIQQGQPFKMFRPESYEAWKDMLVTFDPALAKATQSR